MDSTDPLCCCEYENVHGERAHLCGLLCDCAELDDMCDKIFIGQKSHVNSKNLESIFQVAEDRIRLPWPRGAVKIQFDKYLPFVAIPVLFHLASYNWQSQVLVNGLVLPLVIACKFQTCLRWSYKPRTKFFVHWSLATFCYIFYIYQWHVVGFVILPKTVSPLENLCLMGNHLSFVL